MTSKPFDTVWLDVGRVCQELIEQSSGLLSWEWDDRFSSALSISKDPQHHQVVSVIEGLFPSVWSHESIGQAPQRIVALSNDWGGLRPGQKMFTLDPSDDPLLLAAWWPWSNGKTFSLRVSCVTSSDEARSMDLIRQLKGYFFT